MQTLLTTIDLTSLWLTIKVALVTTLILLLFGTLLALFISTLKPHKSILFEAIVALPLVLPPTVLGFYLLIILSPDGLIGRFWNQLFDTQLTFSFTGLVIGSVIYSLPFAVQPLLSGFRQINPLILEAAASLGSNRWDQFWSITLPLSRSHYLIAATLTFAHTLGEFGVILMIGGNIPEVTQVVSIAIYDHVEAMEYTQAQALSAILLAFSFMVLIIVYGLNHKLETKA